MLLRVYLTFFSLDPLLLSSMYTFFCYCVFYFLIPPSYISSTLLTIVFSHYSSHIVKTGSLYGSINLVPNICQSRVGFRIFQTLHYPRFCGKKFNFFGKNLTFRVLYKGWKSLLSSISSCFQPTWKAVSEINSNLKRGSQARGQVN